VYVAKAPSAFKSELIFELKGGFGKVDPRMPRKKCHPGGGEPRKSRASVNETNWYEWRLKWYEARSIHGADREQASAG
jgi:hypothetical protein